MGLRRCVILTVCMLIFAVSAGAQDDVRESSQEVPGGQIAAGYSSVHDVDTHQPIPGGWFLSADRNVSSWLGITYDLSASGTVTHHLAFLPGVDTHWSTGALLVGPTFSRRYERRAVVFGRVLGGIAEAGSSDDGYAVALGIAPGAGVDLYFSRHLGVRGTADYRFLHGIGTASGAAAAQLWLRTGLVVAFGAR
jgi:hypothetical protein